MSPNNGNNILKVKTRLCESEGSVGGSAVVVMRKKDNYCEVKSEDDREEKLTRHSQVLNSGPILESSLVCRDSDKLIESPTIKPTIRRKSLDIIRNSIFGNDALNQNNDDDDDDDEDDEDDDEEIDDARQAETSFKLEKSDCGRVPPEETDETVLGDHEGHEEFRRLEKARRKKRKRRKRWWATADALVSGVVVCTLGVSSWRGLWNLMDIYPKLFPVWPSMIFGIALHLGFALLRTILHAAASRPPSSRLVRWACAGSGRAYCWLFMCACVLQWRGQWLAWARHVVPEPTRALPAAGPLATAAGGCALAALRGLRNLLAMPYFVSVDRPETTFDFHTRYRKSTREPFLFLLDCIFSVVVVGSLVVFVWRGAWDMLDFYLYPHDKVWSAWGSAVLGYSLAVVTFLLQPLARRACSHLQAARRLLLADLFLLLSFVATINVWRSVWMLLDIYFIPENPLLSNWITHAGCLALLMLLNCANSVMVRGVYIDAEEEGGQCVVFPCYYLRLFFQKERAKKRQRRLEKAASLATATGKDPDVAGAVPLAPKVLAGNHVTVQIPEKEALQIDTTNGKDC